MGDNSNRDLKTWVYIHVRHDMNKTLRHTLSIGILTLFLTQIGFSQSIDKFVDSTIKVDSLNVPTEYGQSYFPKEMFPEVEQNWIKTKKGFRVEPIVKEGTYDSFIVDWYSEQLYAMKEPLLFNRIVDKEVYRFTWLRTFDKPMVFRIENRKGDYILYYKVLDGKGGYEPGRIEVEKTKNLTKKEWLTFKKLIENADFWNMSLGRNSIGLDGSEWILEGLTRTKYRAVTVWSPTEGSFYEACIYLISLSDLTLTENERY